VVVPVMIGAAVAVPIVVASIVAVSSFFIVFPLMLVPAEYRRENLGITRRREIISRVLPCTFVVIRLLRPIHLGLWHEA
jgi:hypothetical protein